MATPVIDLHHRRLQAGFSQEQAEAIASAFEVLDRRITRIELTLRVHTALLVLILAAVLAPYASSLLR